MKKLLFLLNDEKGATLVEYAILIVVIAAVCIASVSMLGTELSDELNNASSPITR